MRGMSLLVLYLSHQRSRRPKGEYTVFQRAMHGKRAIALDRCLVFSPRVRVDVRFSTKCHKSIFACIFFNKCKRRPAITLYSWRRGQSITTEKCYADHQTSRPLINYYTAITALGSCTQVYLDGKLSSFKRNTFYIVISSNSPPQKKRIALLFKFYNHSTVYFRKKKKTDESII